MADPGVPEAPAPAAPPPVAAPVVPPGGAPDPAPTHSPWFAARIAAAVAACRVELDEIRAAAPEVAGAPAQFGNVTQDEVDVDTPGITNTTAAFSRLRLKQIRNGTTGTSTHVARAGSIDEGKYWVTVGFHRSAGAAPEADTITVDDTVDAYIRSAYALACSKSLAGFDAAIDAGALRALCGTAVVQRREGLLVGATRAGASWTWALTPNDLVTSEVSEQSIYRINMGTGLPTLTPAARAAAWPDPLAKLVVVAQGMAALALAETEVAMDCVLLGVAAVPLAGASIANTGHHFLDSERARADAVIKQIQTANNTAALWAAMGDIAAILSCVFHAAVHPVLASFMTEIAMSGNTAEKLMNIGIAAAAVGLPCQPGPLKTATTFLQMSSQVGSAMVNAGHRFALPVLAAMMVALTDIEDGAERITVAGRLLPPLMEVAKPKVAFAFGYYMAKMEETGQGKGTLEHAPSLASVQKTYTMQYSMGFSQVSLDRRFAKAQQEAGYRTAVTMTDHILG